MPEIKAVVEAKAVPPDEAAYQFIVAPVATKLATVAEPQKDCAIAVGADGKALITTSILALVLSQPLALELVTQ